MGDLPRAGIRRPMSPFVLYWPIVLWALGFIEFHLTVFFGPRNGHTLGISLWISLAMLVAELWRCRNATLRVAGMLAGEMRRAPILFWLLCAVQAGMFALASYEAHFPPHWPQEGDAINYHMALPRQHLFWRSLEHLPWSMTDLFSMPLQYGFAAVWFMGVTINKWPQFLGALWAFGILLALGRRQAAHSFSGWIPALAMFTTHGVMVQLGMAMLDLTNLYLLLATWHAAVHRRPFWWVAHIALYAAAKAFHPAQAGVLVLALLAYYYLFERETVISNRRHIVLYGLLATAVFLLISARSIWIAIERAGTPIYPLAVCAIQSVPGCQSEAGAIIRANAKLVISAAGSYGLGYGVSGLFTHFWRVAVPAFGSVNNEYDYPLGLAWPLMLILLLGAIPHWYSVRKVSPEQLMAVLLWIFWWFTSHQSRWLFPVIALGLLATVYIQIRMNHKLLLGSIIISGLFSALSLARSIQSDLNISAADIQSQLQRAIVSNPVTEVAKSKQTLYVQHRVSTVEDVDGLFIFPVGNK